MAMTDLRPDPLAVPPGEWHMYRRDHRLTGRSPMPGKISTPAVRWSFPLGGSENECFPVPGAAGRMDLLFAYGGCVVRTDGTGTIIWKSRSYGINAIGAVEDLDGDGEMEIACSTGYEVIVLAAESGDLLMKHYVGFPHSAGTPAGTLLCHKFDRSSRGMHLIAPMMSAKEVLVFDFRNGKRNGVLAHTLWMDDAFHPTAVAADMDNDGVDELVISKLCGLYVFNVLTGTMTSIGALDLQRRAAPELWPEPAHRYRWRRCARGGHCCGTRGTAHRCDRQRREGEPDPALGQVRGIHLSQRHDRAPAYGKFSLGCGWRRQTRIGVCLFNARGDGRWWLEVLDPLTGTIKLEMPDTYLWGVQDINGDGVSELLIGEEHDRNPAPFSTVQVVSVKGLKAVTVVELRQCTVCGERVSDPPDGGRISARCSSAMMRHGPT